MRLAIISFFCLVSLSLYRAQSGYQDSLMRLEHGFFKTKDDTAAQKFLLEKIKIYLRHSYTGPEVFREVQRIENKKISDTGSRRGFLWNAALISYLNAETDHARNFLNSYSQLQADNSTTYLLLSALLNKDHDTALVRSQMQELIRRDSLFKNLDCLMCVAAYERKHLNFYLVSSLLLPGSGSMMNGYVLKGVVSTVLFAGSVYGIVQMVEHALYLNAFLWGTGVGLKFYAGNIKLTENLFYQAEAKQKNKLADDCELKLQDVLRKYPLSLKGL